MSFPNLATSRRAATAVAPNIYRLGLLLALLILSLGRMSPVTGEESDDPKFTSAPAVAARGRYLLLVDQAKKQMVVDLKAALQESMRAGQLDEANRISKIVEGPGGGAAESLTSAHGKAAQSRFQSAADRAKQEYVVALKGPLAQSLRSAQLNESNRISAEIKQLGGTAAPGAASHEAGTGGFIDLLAKIDPAKDTVRGTWTIENGTLWSSGNEEEWIEIPYQPPEEYDFRVTFTKTGTNCVVQMLSETGIQFVWLMGASGEFTFQNVKGTAIGRNKASVHRPEGIKDKHRYVSVVRVRKNGVETTLDGVAITKWPTDYTDIAPQAWWAMRDSHLLGVGTGNAKTQFHSIEVKEISGPGKFTR